MEVFSFTYTTSAQVPTLTSLASYRAHTEPIDMSVANDIITVGDIMKGPALLQLTADPEGNTVLKELARSYQPSWTTAVELLDEDTIVAADNEGNLQIWQRNKSGIAEDQKRLQVIGESKLWEMVNRIRRSMPSTPFLSRQSHGHGHTNSFFSSKSTHARCISHHSSGPYRNRRRIHLPSLAHLTISHQPPPPAPIQPRQSHQGHRRPIAYEVSRLFRPHKSRGRAVSSCGRRLCGKIFGTGGGGTRVCGAGLWRRGGSVGHFGG